MKVGAKGDKVIELQTYLTDLGFGPELDPEKIDGKFGPHTKNSVMTYQQDFGLVVDGKVGPQTWGSLCEQISLLPTTFAPGEEPPVQPPGEEGQVSIPEFQCDNTSRIILPFCYDTCGDKIDNDSDGQMDNLDPEGCIPPYEDTSLCDCKEAIGISTPSKDLNVSWELKRDANAVLSQDPSKFHFFLCNNLSDEKKYVFYWLNINKDKIIDVAKKRGIDPVAVAGAISWESLENVKDSSPGWSNRWAGPGKVHYKNFGFDDTTAEETEKAGYLSTKTDGERRKILSTVSGSIEYIGAIMKADADAIAEGGYNINYDPPLLTLFYNAWDLEDIEELAQSKKYPAKLSIEGNPMANWVEQNITYLKTALETLYVCPAEYFIPIPTM